MRKKITFQKLKILVFSALLTVSIYHSITQVTDLLEGVRCSTLPLLCERVIELPLREWVVAPALQKDGRYCNKKAQILDENLSQDGEASEESDKGD